MNYLNLLGAFFITGITLLTLKPVAVRVGLVDLPGGRKTHINATPLVGGLGIFLGVLFVSVITPGVLSHYNSLLSLSALILFIGLVDDAKELAVGIRMTGHALVALAMAVVANIQLTSLGWIIPGVEVDLGVLAIPITVFATVGVINAINMSDGIDGLSGGLVIVTLGFIGFLSFRDGYVEQASFLTVIICSILAFLTLNFRRPWNRKALVYLGDAGSTMLGFMLAWILISSTQGEQQIFPPVYALWFLALPLFDTINLLIKRPMRGQSPFRPGSDHLHHALLRRGFSVEQVVLLLVGLAAALGGIGLLGLSANANETFMFALFLGVFALYFTVSDKIFPPQTAPPGISSSS